MEDQTQMLAFPAATLVGIYGGPDATRPRRSRGSRQPSSSSRPSASAAASLTRPSSTAPLLPVRVAKDQIMVDELVSYFQHRILRAPRVTQLRWPSSHQSKTKALARRHSSRRSRALSPAWHAVHAPAAPRHCRQSPNRQYTLKHPLSSRFRQASAKSGALPGVRQIAVARFAVAPPLHPVTPLLHPVAVTVTRVDAAAPPLNLGATPPLHLTSTEGRAGGLVALLLGRHDVAVQEAADAGGRTVFLEDDAFWMASVMRHGDVVFPAGGAQARRGYERGGGRIKEEGEDRARSMRTCCKLDEKMKAHDVGSNKNNEAKKMKDKTMETKETPKVGGGPRTWELGTTKKGYAGPAFGEVITRFKEEKPSGKRKKEVVVRLTEGFLEYMANQEYFPPQPVPFMMDLEAFAMEEKFLAQEKALCEYRDNVLKQYKELGYAEMLLKVTDEEKE
ncbi:hypothetical protein EJB05_40392, partial [Eragrostis curvula]